MGNVDSEGKGFEQWRTQRKDVPKKDLSVLLNVIYIIYMSLLLPPPPEAIL